MRFSASPTWLVEALRIARRHARDAASDAAADLAQDLAVAALEHGQRAERPGAWLERVARNANIDRARREHRRRRLIARAEEATSPRNPEDALLEREIITSVRRAMTSLPAPQRQVAELRFNDELPLDVVAERLGTAPGTARSRLHRTLDTLRRQLGHLRGTLLLGWPTMQTAALSFALFAGATQSAPPPSGESAAPPSRLIAAQLTMATSKPRQPATAFAPSAEKAFTAPATRPERERRTPIPVPPAVLTMTFEDDRVAGDHEAPPGEFVRIMPATRHGSLIDLRATLIPEIAKSLEEF